MEKSDNFYFWLWRAVLCGAFVWWCLGLNLFVYHIAALILVLGRCYQVHAANEPIVIPALFFPIFIMSAVYSFSILIHSQGESGRALAALYNLSFWGMGLCLMTFMANSFALKQIRTTLRVFYFLSLILGSLALIAVLFWLSGVKSLYFYTPFYNLIYATDATPLIQNSLVVRILSMDWFASFSRPRFNAFSPYPTATGGLAMVLLSMLLMSFRIEKKRKILPYILLLLGTALALFMSLSRISLIGLAVSVALVFILERKKAFAWAALFVIFLLLISPILAQILQVFMGLREGSNATRIDIYRYSLDQIDGMDWILGMGLKQREDSFSIPLGSHSTYLSLLFKSGILGLISFLIFQGMLLWRWYQLKSQIIDDTERFAFWRGLGCAFFAMAIWMVTEDLDAPQLLVFIYFSLVGIFEAFRKEILSDELIASSRTQIA
jgi:hypothetical protein